MPTVLSLSAWEMLGPTWEIQTRRDKKVLRMTYYLGDNNSYVGDTTYYYTD